MKRLLVRFSMLGVLVMTGWFLYLDKPVSGAFDCGMAAYNKWQGCDNAYSSTVYIYNNMGSYCDNNSANVCSVAAHSFCQQQATTACQGNPDPACYNSTDNACYWDRYQSCNTQTTVLCHDNVQNAYSNRGNAYGSCMSAGANYSTCIEQLDGECSVARSRAQECAIIYAGEDDWGAKSTCILNSGVHLCE